MCIATRPICVSDGTAARAPMYSPAPVGSGGHSHPMSYREQPSASPPSSSTPQQESGEEVHGSAVIVGTGMASVVRIPVPGTNGLFVNLTPQGWTPKGGSTSTLFIQDVTGKRHLRLDYGYNVKTQAVDYHWNQKGTHADFKIPDHTPAGRGGQALYQSARYFRYAGRVLLVAGVALDVYSIVVARKRMRQVSKVAAGWVGAWAGCKVVGAGGAAAGTLVEPGGGTAVGGFLGCMAGGIGGYAGASWAAGQLYDWVEETFFEPVPEIAAPGAMK